MSVGHLVRRLFRHSGGTTRPRRRQRDGKAQTPHQGPRFFENDTTEWAIPIEDTESSVMPLAVYQLTTTNTPLLGTTTTKTAKTAMMLVGVDTGARIVYLGESEIVSTFLASNPGTDVGTAGTPGYNNISTLLCNTWAWAVNTVLSE